MEIAFCVVILTLLFLVLFTLPISCAHSLKKWPDPSHPPIWPNVFQVDFQEWLDLGPFGGVTRNNGSWYYDYINHTARYFVCYFAIFVSSICCVAHFLCMNI